MNRIRVILFLVLAAGTANAQKKPNVVIMLADNVGYGDIGAYGAGEIRGMPTPRINSIAASGFEATLRSSGAQEFFSPGVIYKPIAALRPGSCREK